MVLGFNDLPDETVELIIDHTQPGFDHRSRTLAQGICRDLLDTHEHDSLVTERIFPQLAWLPTEHLKYYTFLYKLTRYLSPRQLETIVNVNCSISNRIRQMSLIAQENQAHSLAMIASQITQNRSAENISLVANRFRSQLHDQTIQIDAKIIDR